MERLFGRYGNMPFILVILLVDVLPIGSSLGLMYNGAPWWVCLLVGSIIGGYIRHCFADESE